MSEYDRIAWTGDKGLTHLGYIHAKDTLCGEKVPRKGSFARPFDGKTSPTCTACWREVRTP